MVATSAGEVLTAYRTLQMRLDHLLQAVRGRRIPLTQPEFEAEVAALEARCLPELGNGPIRKLANNLLHQGWHPTTAGVAFAWAGSGNEGERKINFTEEGDLRESLFTRRGTNRGPDRLLRTAGRRVDPPDAAGRATGGRPAPVDLVRYAAQAVDNGHR